jgi:hypothetical protein
MPQNRYDDLKNNGVSGVTIVPAVYTADQDGTGVDFGAGSGLVSGVVSLGAINNATSGSIAFTESSDNTTFTAIAGSTAVTFTGTSDNTLQVSAAFERTKQYVRAEVDLSGATISAGIAITLHSGKKSY